VTAITNSRYMKKVSLYPGSRSNLLNGQLDDSTGLDGRRPSRWVQPLRGVRIGGE